MFIYKRPPDAFLGLCSGSSLHLCGYLNYQPVLNIRELPLSPRQSHPLPGISAYPAAKMLGGISCGLGVATSEAEVESRPRSQHRREPRRRWQLPTAKKSPQGQAPAGVSNPSILLGMRPTWMITGTQSADLLTPSLERVHDTVLNGFSCCFLGSRHKRLAQGP